MATTMNLKDLLENGHDQDIQLLTRKPVNLIRPVSDVRLLLDFSIQNIHEAHILWIVPSVMKSTVLWDSLLLQIASNNGAGMIIPPGQISEATILLAERLSIPIFTVPLSKMDYVVHFIWSRLAQKEMLRLHCDLEKIKEITSLWEMAKTTNDFIKELSRLGIFVRINNSGESKNLLSDFKDEMTMSITWGRGRGVQIQTAPGISLSVLQHIRLLAGILLDREAGEIESELRHRSEFLLELLVDPRIPTGSLIHAAKQFQLDLGRYHTVVLWDLDSFRDFIKQGIPESSVLRLKSQLFQQIEREARLIFGHGLVLPHSDEFVLIVESPEALNALNVMQGMSYVHEALRPILHRFHVPGITAGVGFSYNGVQGMRKSFEEAHEALVVGRSRHGFGSITHFKDIGIERFLYGWIDSPRSKSLSEDFLKPLLNEPNAQELLETLEIYMESRGRLSVAAAQLKIHRNSLRYRLDRISHLLHVDVDDSTTQLVLQLALKALNMENKLHKK